MKKVELLIEKLMTHHGDMSIDTFERILQKEGFQNREKSKGKHRHWFYGDIMITVVAWNGEFARLNKNFMIRYLKAIKLEHEYFQQ